MSRNVVLGAVVSLSVVSAATASAQVKHIQDARPGGIATAVWVDNMLYVSGQLPSPATPADRDKGTPAVWGDTKTQTMSVFQKIEGILKEQGLTMGDVVMMRIYMAGDPANNNQIDFAGMNAAYNTFFGTAAQPNKPARSTFQVAALVNKGPLLEVEVQAVKSK
jgi:enamine deaminase RidA (YjgF/YER057c/UK114 family)